MLTNTKKQTFNKQQFTVENQKAQLQKRINQLQRKLKSKDTNYFPISEIKNTIQQSQFPKNSPSLSKKNNKYNKQNTNQIKNKQYQSEKINQIYDMMKTILVGQKHLEQQIQSIKKSRLNQIEERPKRVQFPNQKNQQKTSNLYQKPIFLGYSDQTIEETSEKSNTHSFQKQQQIKILPKNISKVRKRAISSNIYNKNIINILNKKNKDNSPHNLEQLLFQENRRVDIKQQTKQKVWKDIENKVKIAKKQYLMRNNSKHEHQYLLNTLRFQKKMKEDLISKVYCQYRGNK